VVGLNVVLAVPVIGDWLGRAGAWRPLVWVLTVPTGIALLALLAFVTFEPMMTRRKLGMAPVTVPDTTRAEAALAPRYHRILVPLDHTQLDQLALNHAAAMARIYGAKIFLLHVEEGVTSQIYGRDASTAEVELGEQYLDRIAQSLREQSIEVETSVSHSNSPTKEILRYSREIRPDLVIMGAHGHGGLKDLIFGNTINPVRHHLTVPMLIVRPGKT
jgi:manganese transport protein